MKYFIYIALIIALTSSCQQSSTKTKKQDLPQQSLTLKYAKWFKIKYYDNYKEIIVLNPWTKEVYWKYHLYKKKLITDSQGNFSILTYPHKAAVLSGTQIGMFNKLSILKEITSIANVNYIYNSSIRASVKNGEINEWGDGATLNTEKAYLSQVDIVFSTAWDKIDPQLLKLINMGIPVAFVMDWQEDSPLARAEWIKFVAVFYDMEEQADSIFNKIEQQYLSLKEISIKSPNRPSVFHGTLMSGTWYIAGGKSFMAQFYADANANYLWENDSTTGSLPLNFEAVFEKAKDADYWINSSSFSSCNDFLAEDNRYTFFKAFKDCNIYSNGVISNSKYPSNFWEEGSINPDKVLKDIISILHPQLFPKHRLQYFRDIKKEN